MAAVFVADVPENELAPIGKDGWYSKHLRRYFLRKGVYPRDVMDLVQQVYVRVYDIEARTNINKPLAYMYGVAAHVLAEFREEGYKYDANYTQWDESDENFHGEDFTINQKPVDILAEDLGMHQEIERALSKLADTHRQVIIMHKGFEMTYKEVADELGISLHTVGKYVTQSLKILREHKFDEDFDHRLYTCNRRKNKKKTSRYKKSTNWKTFRKAGSCRA